MRSLKSPSWRCLFQRLYRTTRGPRITNVHLRDQPTSRSRFAVIMVKRIDNTKTQATYSTFVLPSGEHNLPRIVPSIPEPIHTAITNPILVKGILGSNKRLTLLAMALPFLSATNAAVSPSSPARTRYFNPVIAQKPANGSGRSNDPGDLPNYGSLAKLKSLQSYTLLQVPQS